jgi:solute:Na+ symporter, SSS family
MNPGAIPIAIISGIVALGSGIGFYAGKRRPLNLEEWTVAGRGLGLVLVWLLTAGELFTVFSLLGLSGWIYSRGGPTLYILAYVTLAQVLGFFILPPIWELGRAHGLQTQPDFFARRYGSTLLGAFVALAGVAFLILYLQLQLTGLGIIVETASFERIGRTPAMLVSGALVAGFVFTSGVRGVAWVSVLKDFLLVAAVFVIGIGLPYIHFGGIGPMFDALARARPGHFLMPGATPNLGHSWYVSAVLLSSLSFTWPHIFGSAFTAKSGDTLRWNAVIMPFYVIPLLLIIFAGCAAILVVPHLANGDLALLMVVRRTFPPWILGVIGGAGALTAMVPAAIQILTASTLLAKNLCRPILAPAMTDAQVARLARFAVAAITAAALFLAIKSSASLVGLLLIAYAGTGQFFPGIVLGLCWPRVTTAGIFTGLAAGLALAAFLILTRRDPFLGINAGFVALVVNSLLAVAVSFLTPAQPSGFDRPCA